MKIINCLLISFLLTFNFISTDIKAQENGLPTENFFLHTVEKGQSLYSIAIMYNVTQDEIIRLNPGAQEKIYAGGSLKIPQYTTPQSTQFFHTIQPKETLYQLTQKYKISAKEIVDANPGLSAENFKIGEVIVIPISSDLATNQTSPTSDTPEQNNVVENSSLDGQSIRCRDMHKVKKKETIFSISRHYGISERELIEANPELKNGVLKKGAFLCIPYRTAVVVTTREDAKKESTADKPMSDRDLFNLSKEKGEKISTIRTAVILPFMLNDTKKEEAVRMLEFYEGFLIAVDSLKKSGVSFDIYTYDSGSSSTSIQPILQKSELKNMDIIFGPYHQEHVAPLAEFAKENDIKLVIPFSSRIDEVFMNPSIFLVNTPQSYLYSEVYEHFFRKFPSPNIIIMQAPANIEKDRSDFISGFKQELAARNLPYQTISTAASEEDLKQVLDPTKENIFIPTSASNTILTQFLPQMTLVVRDNPEIRINLFGYPDWQTYTKDHISAFYELDTYFYSSFYTNNLFPQAVDFSSTYWRWYGKDMLNSYPKYGMLGFDVGYFFLKGLAQFGTNFENDLSKVNVSSIQTGFKFERSSNWGGFINRKVFFVHFTKDYELVKLNFE